MNIGHMKAERDQEFVSEPVAVKRVSPVIVQVQAGWTAIQDAKEEWLQLWEEVQTGHPFCHPDWIGAHVRAFEPRSTLLLLTARIEERLVGLLPLVQDRVVFHGFPARRVRAATNSHSFRFDILRVPGPDSDAVLAAMWKGLQELRAWDVLEIPYLPYPGTGEQLLALAQADGFRTLHIAQRVLHISLDGVGGREKPWLEDARSNFRKDLRKWERRATADLKGALQLERIDQPDPEQLERFFAIEGSGWKGRQGTAISCRPKTKKFYSAIASAFAKRRCWSLYFLKVGDSTLAGLFSLRIGNAVVGLKLGYREEYRSYAPGHLLINEVARESWQRTFCEFAMGPESAYKLHWTKQGRTEAHCFIFNRHTYGRFLFRYKTEFRPEVKRLLGRVTGCAEEQGEAAERTNRDDQDSSGAE